MQSVVVNPIVTDAVEQAAIGNRWYRLSSSIGTSSVSWTVQSVP
jgi:hypothetical protein